MKLKIKSFFERFVKREKIKLSPDTVNAIKKSYQLGNAIDLRDVVHDLVSKLIFSFKPKNVLDPHSDFSTLLKSINNKNKVGYIKDPKTVIWAGDNSGSTIRIGDIYNEKVSEKFDAIVSFMPINKHTNFINQIFHLINENLNDGGNLLLILPSGFFFGSQNSLKNGREELIKKWNITHIIDLPKSNNTGVNLRLLIINKSTSNFNSSVLMAQLNDSDKSDSKENIIQNIISKKGSILVNKKEIILSSRWEREFYDPAVRQIESDLIDKKAQKLSDITSLIVNGKFIPNNLRKTKGEFLVIDILNIQDSILKPSPKDYYISSSEVKNYKNQEVQGGDLILNGIGHKFKFCFVPSNFKGIITQNLFLIRSKNNEFINQYLSSNTGKEEFLNQIIRYSKGVTFSRISLKDLKNILIPKLPSESKSLVEGFKSEYDALKLLSDEFKLRNWEVEIDTPSKSQINKNLFNSISVKSRLGDQVILDIGLFHNKNLISFVEIKNTKDQIFSLSFENQIKEQCRRTIRTLNRNHFIKIRGCFVIIDFGIYFFDGSTLDKLKSYPQFSDYKNVLLNQRKNRQQKDTGVKFSLSNDDSLEYPIEENKINDLDIKSKFLIEMVLKLQKNQNTILEEMKILNKNTRSIKSDTSKILTSIVKMMTEIKEIKSLTEDTNDSIEKSISKIINSIDENYDFNKIDDYIPKVKEWFRFWDLIEENTKIFMPGSEWLYENIKNSDFKDFSPFVLYSCRALENELLKKIFLSFHNHVNELNEEEKRALFIWNKEGLGEKKIKEYQSYYKVFKLNIENNYDNYNLGYIRQTLSILPSIKNKKGSERYRRSPLLIEFNNFLSLRMRRVDEETLEKLRLLIKDYRNKSAHVGIIDSEKAMAFQNQYKYLMNTIIEKF